MPASTVFRSPTTSRPLALVNPHTSLMQNPSHDHIRRRRRATHKGALRNGGCVVPIYMRSRSCGSGGATGKRAMIFKDREIDRESVALGDVANVSSSSSAFSSHVKARNRAPDELRRPLMPKGGNSLEEDEMRGSWTRTTSWSSRSGRSSEHDVFA